MKNNDWWQTASRAEIEAYQGKKLHWFLKNRLVPFTSHYKQVFAEEGIDPNEIRTLDDLRRVPFTHKRMIAQPRDFVIIPFN